MDYSILAEGMPHDAAGLVVDVHSVYAQLLEIPDPRQRRGCRYAWAFILLLIVLAKLAGEDKPRGIAQWVRARAAWLVKTFDLARPDLPCANTYRRTLSRPDTAEALDAHVERYLAQLPTSALGRHIALDGKTVRGTIPTGESQGLHLLAAYVPAQGRVLRQVAVDGKENEISAAPRVLDGLDLQGKIVTGDAMLAQRSLSAQVVEAGGDYVWTVKDNQPSLRADIAELFAPTAPLAKGFNTGPTDFRQARTTGTGHGRIETRTLTASSLLGGLHDWPGLAQVFRLERNARLLARGTTRHEVVYGITSLSAPAASPARLLDLVRQHWGIENGLHYRRDVTFHEEAGRTKCWPLAHALAAIHNLLLGLLPHAGHHDLAQARRHFAAHPDDALRLLLARPG
ncbi:MAG: ISAs1 family transposase [Anaerolineales bacterium]|nr:ISAs1 family transposase [Anaerolineales bacterium]